MRIHSQLMHIPSLQTPKLVSQDHSLIFFFFFFYFFLILFLFIFTDPELIHCIDLFDFQWEVFYKHNLLLVEKSLSFL